MPSHFPSPTVDLQYSKVWFTFARRGTVHRAFVYVFDLFDCFDGGEAESDVLATFMANLDDVLRAANSSYAGFDPVHVERELLRRRDR
jgi:hypothetical protein